MPWMECSLMSQRQELVQIAGTEGANVAALARRYGVSRKTAYKWRSRFASTGAAGLTDQSRRPRHSPSRSSDEVEAAVLAVRREHPAWGGRKIRAVLVRQGISDVPAASTITEILRRHDLLSAAEGAGEVRDWQRFEHPRPNDLWQMDFKGHFALANSERCHPLTILDDHSRFNVGLRACENQRGQTVKEELTVIFGQYGLPRRMLMDNGSPWGDCPENRFTPLTVWLTRLDVGVSHGRPYHPQTQGKDERFHRTLNVELLRDRRFDDHPHCQRGFDGWRSVYNFDRPHEALAMQTPAQRYEPSSRSMPATLPPIEYPAGDAVRKVQYGGWISYRGDHYHLPKAFHGEPVALRPTATDGVLAVYYCHRQIATVDLHTRNVAAPPCAAPLAALAEPHTADDA